MAVIHFFNRGTCENPDRILERDSMACEVIVVLPWIPSVVHRRIFTLCIYVNANARPSESHWSKDSKTGFNGHPETGKAVLRNYVNATVGFQDLEKRTKIPAKSLMRMLGPKGSVLSLRRW